MLQEIKEITLVCNIKIKSKLKVVKTQKKWMARGDDCHMPTSLTRSPPWEKYKTTYDLMIVNLCLVYSVCEYKYVYIYILSGPDLNTRSTFPYRFSCPIVQWLIVSPPLFYQIHILYGQDWYIIHTMYIISVWYQMILPWRRFIIPCAHYIHIRIWSWSLLPKITLYTTKKGLETRLFASCFADFNDVFESPVVLHFVGI